mmetsp:Transcript_35373/g.34409  ORF Transcript_35373/g.34409 Transcript_35373/m.34409 type:complete len:84 (+) Transcript_35373:700-951(+)
MNSTSHIDIKNNIVLNKKKKAQVMKEMQEPSSSGDRVSKTQKSKNEILKEVPNRKEKQKEKRENRRKSNLKKMNKIKVKRVKD